LADDAIRAALAHRERCADGGVGITCLGDPSYPDALLDLEDPPAALYWIGNLSLASTRGVALVGARRATAYGRRVVRDFAGHLAGRGVTVVSGLAAGIDAEAHAAALERSGPTVAVLGTGVDVAYPATNHELHQRVGRDGLLLSELPPGRRAHPGAFPRRNRLIAALAQVIVVVEAGLRSGSLITAQVGTTLGRWVAAVPGPLGVESSEGANLLLRDGAQVATSFDDVLAMMSLSSGGDPRGAPGSTSRSAGADRPAIRGRDARLDATRAQLPSASGLPLGSASTSDPFPLPFEVGSAEGRVMEVLQHGPRGADELVRACGMSPRDVVLALSSLTLDGVIIVDHAGVAAISPRVPLRIPASGG